VTDRNLKDVLRCTCDAVRTQSKAWPADIVYTGLEADVAILAG